MVTAYGSPDAPVVMLQMVDDHDLEGIETEVTAIRTLTDADFYLMAIKVQNWNADLSPWAAPAVFGKEEFGNGASNTLAEVLKHCTDQKKTYIIGGYSLAELFALWAAYQTDVFKGVAAASPSVWFPGFLDHMRGNAIHADSVYLSLGDKEEKTRNPVMATVESRIKEAHELLTECGINTVLEWNHGNHFMDADIRTAKAFAWAILKEIAGGWEDEVEKAFFKNDKASEFTVEYYERSWPDALQYGFLSANIGGSGKYLRNIQEGDIVYCHIAGCGFVGIGLCTGVAIPMAEFNVNVDGKETPIAQAPWLKPEYKAKLDISKEIFIRVEWKSFVEDSADGYWEKGMTSVPLVAYMLNDQTTHKKVRQHFGYKD